MRTTVAARYARWSAVFACLLALAVAGVYTRHSLEVRQARREMPPAVPPSVQQQSAAFSFSKVDGQHTEFTVRASRATEFAEGDHTLLEDVWVTLYGASGQRLDNLRTQSCEYKSETGDIRCAGAVQMDLQSAQDARLHPAAPDRPNAAANIVHVYTSQILFNHQTGLASTDRPVRFRFPQGEGRGVGFRYESARGEIRLLRDVTLVFHHQVPPGTARPLPGAPGDVTATGSSLIYSRDERRLHLLGPVAVRQNTRELSAKDLELEFDMEQRARQLVASGSPVLRETTTGGTRTISAEQLSALFSPEGAVQRAIAEGNVHATARNSTREDQLDASRAELLFAQTSHNPQRLTVTGNVREQSALSAGTVRHLATSVMVLDFAAAAPGVPARIEHVTTPAATLDSQGPATVSGQTVSQQIHLKSQHLDAELGEDNQLRQVAGKGGVEVRRQVGANPWQTSASREMLARFDDSGEWSSVDQSGDVHLDQAEQSAQAERAHFDHADDTVALAGSVSLTDGRTRTTAQSGLMQQAKGEFQAKGRVVTSDLSATGAPTSLGAGPARISADHMVADTVRGHATYTGAARLWQGDSLVEADAIDLDHATQTLTATGHVHAVFPQARWAPPDGAATAKPSAAKTEYWHTEAQRMTYNSNDGRGRLEGDTRADSGEGTIRADAMDLFFAPVDPIGRPLSGETAVKSTSAGASGVAGGRQLVRASAEGHVVVDQEDRHGTGTRAYYTADEGKIVLAGGPPTVRDSSGNVTTGRQLTFYFRDDTIHIDSAEGLRTLTLHRVEK